MRGFSGGSAYAMARQVADGIVLVTERTYRYLNVPQLDKLSFEMDKLLRETRGAQAALEDLPAIQKRNRRIQRLNTARLMLQTHRRGRR